MNSKDGRTKVLFVCIGNSCRSTMAEAISRRDASDVIEAFSAGLAPLGFVTEGTEQTLMSNGYEVGGLESKGISPEAWSRADIVINMSGRQRDVTFYEYSKVEDWEIEDPYGEDPATYQQVFEKISKRVEALVEECRRKQEAGDQQEALAGGKHHAQKSSVPLSPSLLGVLEKVARWMNLGPAFRASLNAPPDAETELIKAETPLTSDDLDREGSSSRILTPRTHLRKRVTKASYIDLGNSNWGILLDVSEGGLSLKAALRLTDAHFSSFRFQLPHCSGWIKARGEIAWGESRKEVGVRFAGLSEEARQQIREWISSDALPSRGQEQIEKFRQAQNLCVASMILESQNLGEVIQTDLQAGFFWPDPAASSPQRAEVRVAASRPPAPAQIPSAKKDLRGRLRAKDREDLGRQLLRIGAIAGLIVVLTLTVGWIGRNLNAGSDAGNKTIEAAVRQTSVMSEALKAGANPVNGRTHAVPAPGVEKMIPQARSEEPRPPEKPQNEKQKNPTSTSAKLPQQVRSVPRPSPPAILKHVNRPAERAPAPIQKTKEPSVSAVRGINATAPVVHPIAHPQSTENPPAPAPQMAANIALVASPDSGPAKEVLSAELKKNESEPSPPRPAESLGNVTGLVAIHTDPYPSLRISAERSSKKSSRGKSLEFGHLVSHVEPAYPEAAKQRGIEGTVRLHAIFGRDGAVANLSSVSGPPVLVAAAMNAVRDWHYSQTFLDSKPIEIEEDITVVFRLSNAAGTKN